MSAIKLDNLDISYGDTKVVHGVSLDIAEGESFALVGESGSANRRFCEPLPGWRRTGPDQSRYWARRAAMASTGQWRGRCRWCFRTHMARCIRARPLTRH